MAFIEEEPPQIQSGSRCKRNSRDKRNPHHVGNKKKIAKNGSKRKRSSISLTDLPSNVLVEILARLPLRTLFVARSVCKNFGFLTTHNPHFINLHSANAAQILVFQFGASDVPSCLLRMADHELDYKYSRLKPPLFQLPKVGTYFLVNSCNGLLYFTRNGPDDFHSLVCNPVTSEYIIIPDDPRMRLHSQNENSWLGFSPGTQQYKVLRIFCKTNKVAAQVYVIGSDTWRDIGEAPLRCLFRGDFCQTQDVNGFMYWHSQSWPSLTSFDFEREKFGEVALPLGFEDEGFMAKQNVTSIGVLGGCLCLTCNDYYVHRVDLWVMSGNRESWTKDFVIYTMGHRRPFDGGFKPLQFLGNGEILMLWRRNTFAWYNPRTESLRYCILHSVNLDHNIVALTPSFVPLKDALNVEEVLTQLRPRGDEKGL